MPNWAGVTIAWFALLFTFGSFWWINARPGRLRSHEHNTFAASEKFPRIPFMLYSSGPQPCVVRDLRISLPPLNATESCAVLGNLGSSQRRNTSGFLGGKRRVESLLGSVIAKDESGSFVEFVLDREQVLW